MNAANVYRSGLSNEEVNDEVRKSLKRAELLLASLPPLPKRTFWQRVKYGYEMFKKAR